MDATARFAIWVRAAGSTTESLELVLWPAQRTGGEPRVGDKQFARFTIDHAQWRCVETALTLPLDDLDRLRAELYFDAPDAVYAIDDAYLAIGDQPLCPPQELLLNPGFEATPVTPWQEIRQCLVTPTDGAAHSGNRFVRVHKTANCASLFQDVYGAIQPGDAATFSVWVRAAEVTPARGRLALRAIGSATELAELPFTLTDNEWTCLEVSLAAQAVGHEHWRPEIYFSSEGSLFDVDDAHLALSASGVCPQTHYALERLEWLPGDAAYRDLPFCPQQALSPDTIAIFLVCHLVDPAFRPAAPYAGIYADVPESHRRSMWIEALYEQIGFVERSNCPQAEGELRFCPQAPLLRQDLLHYVAAAAKIKPTPDAGDSHYIDLHDRPELAALATALWQAGVLPDDDPSCPDLGLGSRFCRDAPALRIDAAVWMVRAFDD